MKKILLVLLAAVGVAVAKKKLDESKHTEHMPHGYLSFCGGPRGCGSLPPVARLATR